MKNVYLTLAIRGALVPYWFLFQFISVEGLNLPGFLSALFANGAVGGLSADLFISSFVFWLAMYQQRSQGKGPNIMPYVLLNLLVGLSSALPAYLYTRESRLG